MSSTSSNFSEQEEFFEQDFHALEGRGIKVEERTFERCSFKKCVFAAATFKRCRFVECKFENCDFSNIVVNGSSFRDTCFLDCKLLGINWTAASDLTHFRFERCLLNFSNFLGLDLRKSAIIHSLAREADFGEANLTEVDCRGTDFASARFSNTNLTKADFRQAQNYAIRPNDNQLKKTKFSLPEATLMLYGLDIVLSD